MSTVKCYNLTDVETPELRNRHLVGATIAVRTVLIPPGGSAEVPDDPMARRDIDSYVALGALSVDTLPLHYVIAKGQELKASQEDELLESASTDPQETPAPVKVRTTRRKAR